MRSLSLILFIYYFFTSACSNKYSLDDITADNYQELLKQNFHSLHLSKVEECIPDFINLYSQDFIADPELFKTGELNASHEKNEKYHSAKITSTRSKMVYTCLYNKNKEAFQISIYTTPMNYSLKLKEICDRFISKGYKIKKTKLLNGNDILIKEVDLDFIIVEINRFYEFPNPPMGLTIRSYDKQ